MLLPFLAKTSSTTNLLIHFIAYKRQHIHYYDPNRIWWSKQAASKWRTINMLQQQQRRLTKRENLFIFCAITKSPLLLSLRIRDGGDHVAFYGWNIKKGSRNDFFPLVQGFFFLSFLHAFIVVDVVQLYFKSPRSKKKNKILTWEVKRKGEKLFFVWCFLPRLWQFRTEIF